MLHHVSSLTWLEEELVAGTSQMAMVPTLPVQSV